MKALEAIPFRSEGPEPLLREIPKGAPYPVGALGPLRYAVEAVQGMTQAPVAIPAQSALAVASLAVQGFANVETLGGQRPLSLYALTIAQSGQRKSSCDAPLMEALREFEKQQATAQRGEMESWRNAQSIWKSERDRILGEKKSRKAKGLDCVRAELDALGPEPVAPPAPDRVVTEPTVEGLTRLFAQGHPSLGIFSDEGGQFLGGYAMNKDNRQKTLAALNDLWQGNPIRRTRQGDGSITLYGRRLAMHLMVQPRVAHSLLADPMATDTGFLPRFLICEPPSTIGTRLHGNTRRDDAALSRFGALLRAILSTTHPMDPDTRELTPRLLGLSQEARELLIVFSDTIEMQQAPGGELASFTSFASKAAEQAARIAGVLTLWGNVNAPEVTPQAMEWGIELAQFYLHEAVRLGNAATVSEEIERAEALREWLLNKWPYAEITLREVVQRASGALRESPKARAAVALLVKHGWLVPLSKGSVIRGAQRKEAWLIVRERDVV